MARSILGSSIIISKLHRNFNLTLNCKNYVSRAHPKPRPTHAILNAIRGVLQDVEERKQKRAERWDLNKIRRERAGNIISDEGPFRNQDETISIALNLNLDPRKPNQAIRGQIAMPHGTGRQPKLAVFTLSEEVANIALSLGASISGGQDLLNDIASGEKLDQFDHVLATPDVLAAMGKTCARVLGPRGLMPSPKMGTVVNEIEIPSAIREQLAGKVSYRTDKAGIVHAPVGVYSFGVKNLGDNLRVFLEGIVEAEPELDKKAKKQRKGGKGGKFILKAHLGATQGKSYRLDLKTVDPTSPFFMTDL